MQNIAPTKLKKNTYTISARGKQNDEPIFNFLKNNFGNLPHSQIESVFGFVEQSTLYGGRPFNGRQLSNRDVVELNISGIGLRIPMTNHSATLEEYKLNRALLKKYHNNINSVICTNDELAGWIREDFPNYEIEASVIKNINSLHKLDKMLDVYNTIVLPMPSNDDLDLLTNIEDKSRVRLFANGGCAYTCPARICYRSISDANKYQGSELRCSSTIKEREMKGMLDFDIQQLSSLGYHKFKLLRARPGSGTGY
jgi:hypothetical protein